MTMKAVWKGFIGFGLVNIPIALYSAVSEERMSFKLLHEKDNGKIHYKRVCGKCGEEVDWGDIVKGLKVGKEEYIVLSKKEIDDLKPKKDDLLEIHEFVHENQIKWIYLNKHYFIGPSEGAERAYFLFKKTLEETNRVAIADFVLREKEYLVAIKPYEKGLLLSIMNYYNEIRDIKNVANISTKTSLKKKEKELAIQLIDQLTNNEFDPSKYKETFTENLKEAIEKKMEGEKISIKKEKTKETEDLIQALEASVQK